MGKIPVPEDGLPLRDVLPKHLEPADWSLYLRLVYAWNKAERPEPLQGSAILNLTRLAPEFLLDALPNGSLKESLKREFSERWDDGPRATISGLFTDETLRAWGRLLSPSAALERIPSCLWKQIGWLDIEQSAVEFCGREAAGRTFCDVRVFHISDSPDTLGSVSKLALNEAFSRFVVGPHEAGVLIEDDNIVAPEGLGIFNPKAYAENNHPIWPAYFERWTPNPILNERALSGPDDRAAMHRRLQDRATILLQWLRRGRLTAWGIPANGRALVEVPRGSWSSPEILIDFMLGEIQDASDTLYRRIELHAPDNPPNRGETGEAVVAIVPESQSAGSNDADEEAPRDRGGRPPEFPWEDVKQHLIILADQGQLPEAIAALVREIQIYVGGLGFKEPGETTIKDWLDRKMPELAEHIRKKKREKRSEN